MLNFRTKLSTCSNTVEARFLQFRAFLHGTRVAHYLIEASSLTSLFDPAKKAGRQQGRSSMEPDAPFN
jgi:hypothetical protein